RVGGVGRGHFRFIASIRRIMLSGCRRCAIMARQQAMKWARKQPGKQLRGLGMSRYALVAAALFVSVSTAPCFAVDAKQKMATCKFGADDQKLQGAARDAFLKKCMANRNDPRGPGSGAAVAPKQ